jgi:hypothetical protein
MRLRDTFASPHSITSSAANHAGRCLSLAHVQHGAGIADIGQDRQPSQTGDNLPQKFEALRSSVA